MHKTLWLLLTTLLAACHPGIGTFSELDVLDEELAVRQHYFGQREARIDSLRRLAADPTASGLRQYELMQQLYDEYAYYQIDSTFAYLDRCALLAQELADGDLRKDIDIKDAWATMQDGDLFHPLRYIDTLDVSHSPGWLKGNYYITKLNIYNVLAGMMRDQEPLQAYAAQLTALRDSAFRYRPDDWLLEADILAHQGKAQTAIDMVQTRLEQPANARLQGIAYNFLARVYADLGQPKQQKRCLALSAIADVRNGVREYESLIELAVLLYQEGDTRHAFQYISHSMEDAADCGSKLRLVEVSDHMPLIADSYSDMHLQARRIYQWLLAGVVLFLLLLAAGLAVLRHKNLRLAQANTRQLQLNAQLHEANETKQQYVMQFMNLSLDFLGRMETFRSNINKVAQRRNFDELAQAIKAGRNLEQEVQMFYARFDDAFLHIHPQFVSQFNALLQPDEQVQLSDDQRLNTELRLFALMRLGINDANSVAAFLRCSLSTIYNYRTKMRNRALSRDTFEADVMRIE